MLDQETKTQATAGSVVSEWTRRGKLTVVAGGQNGRCTEAEENGKDDEFSDFTECLGYMPPRTEKPAENKTRLEYEERGYLLCLGYWA